MAKQYGLILSDKKTQKPTFQPSKNVFGEEGDSDEEANKKPVLLRPSQNINRQAKVMKEKALLDDPTVYQYDEIYDSMADKKKEESVKIKQDKKPRYIENLLKAASKRKIENERRVERQVQKEREKEGEEYADKEVFVTSAYKKKLEELRQEEEREKREEYLESIGDVTKQGDLGGFYRHLYEQKLGTLEEKQQAEEKKQAGESKDEQVNEKVQSKSENDKSRAKNSDDHRKRNYRKRAADEILSEGELEESDDEVNRSGLEGAKKKIKNDENLDADSDFSVNDPSSDEDEKTLNISEKVVKPKTKLSTEAKDTNHSKAKEEIHTKENTPPLPEKIEKPVEPPKPKIDIWKKRTVGDVFDQALKRYYVRKAARGS